MKDYLVRGTAFDKQVRVFAARTTQLAEEIRRRHNMLPTAAAAMGRAVTAGAMMGSMLKGNESLTIQIRGNGPMKHIIVDANAKGEVKGYAANPYVHLPKNKQGKLDVAGAVGRQGTLTVIKDLGMKEPYHGSVPLVSGELGDDFTYYFAVSEQTRSAVGLGVLVNPDHSVKASGGFIIQLLPDVADPIITLLEERLKEMRPISTLIEQGLTPEEMLEDILGQKPHILETKAITFSCHCSKEKVEGALISLGVEEVEKLLEEQGQAEVTCHFCNEQYILERDELENLLQNMKKEQGE
ncbi:MAG: Hsp33 family molecular chaperone HslO [Bacillaceae bacterium]|nr:Hsp33 family molecular chaperone HslO [Bacillaceae bacterium]